MKQQKVKKMSLTKVEDTLALKWARTVNRGEEKRNADKIKILQRATTLSCHEVDREKDVLQKFLEKVQMSTGHLSKDTPLSTGHSRATKTLLSKQVKYS